MEVLQAHVIRKHLGNQPDEGEEPVARHGHAQEEADEEEEEQEAPEPDPRCQQGIVQLRRGGEPPKEAWCPPEAPPPAAVP